MEIVEVIACEEAVELFPGSAWMVGYEGVSGVLTSQIQERLIPARVILNPDRDIVNLTLNRDPEIPRFVVTLELLKSNVLLLLVRNLTLHSGSKQKKKPRKTILKTNRNKNRTKRSTNQKQEKVSPLSGS